jgi:hypothetical protein
LVLLLRTLISSPDLAALVLSLEIDDAVASTSAYIIYCSPMSSS